MYVWPLYHGKCACCTTTLPVLPHTIHCAYSGMVMILLASETKIYNRHTCTVWRHYVQWVLWAILTYTGEVLNHIGNMCFQIFRLCVGYKNMQGSRCDTFWTECHMHCSMECHPQHPSTKESFWSYMMHTLSPCVLIYTLWVWCPHRFDQVARCLAYQPHHCSPYYYQLVHWTALFRGILSRHSSYIPCQTVFYVPSEWTKRSRWPVSLALVLAFRSLIRSVELCWCWNSRYGLAFSEVVFPSVVFCHGFQMSLHLEHRNTRLPSKHRITLPSCKRISCALRTARAFS